MRNHFLLFYILLTPSVFACDFPDGWRLPTEKELSAEPFRNAPPSRNAKIEGDFNEDGNTDYAFLLKSTHFSGEGLLVKLSTGTEYEWQVIDEIHWGEEYPDVSLVMGIDLAIPDKYKTACGKGYWECEEHEPEILDLKLPSIWHFKFESSASIWLWDASTNSFIEIHLND